MTSLLRFYKVKEIIVGARTSTGIVFTTDRMKYVGRIGYVEKRWSDGDITLRFATNDDCVAFHPSWLEGVARTDEAERVNEVTRRHFVPHGVASKLGYPGDARETEHNESILKAIDDLEHELRVKIAALRDAARDAALRAASNS